MTIDLQRISAPFVPDFVSLVERQREQEAHLRSLLALHANPLQDIANQAAGQLAAANAKLIVEAQAINSAWPSVVEAMAAHLDNVQPRVDQIAAVQVQLEQALSPVRQVAQGALDALNAPLRQLSALSMDVNRILGTVPTSLLDEIAAGAIQEAERLAIIFPNTDASAFRGVADAATRAGTGLVAGLGTRASEWWAQANRVERVIFFWAFSVMVMIILTCAQGVSNPAHGPSDSVLAPYGSPTQMTEGALEAGLIATAVRRSKNKGDAG